MNPKGSYVISYIGLGSNLYDPLRQVALGLTALSEMPRTTLLITSSLYRTPPVGGIEQDDFINAVAVLETRLEPLQLLAELQAIEQRQGRIRGGQQWGPRTLDLDLLLYGNVVIEHAELVVPHPEMERRGFVLLPLSEVAPDLSLPDGRYVANLAAACDCSGIVRC